MACVRHVWDSYIHVQVVLLREQRMFLDIPITLQSWCSKNNMPENKTIITKPQMK